jgi:shikimate kinase
MSTSSKPNIYLVGFMGTGKSTIGRQLAERLDYQFLDSDAEIERISGMTIPDLFKEQGESVFRKMEKEFVDSGHPTEGCVVSCGGGLIFQEGLKELLQEKGIVISLFASAETIYERTRTNANRPLLAVEDPMAEIQALLEKRLPVYQAAGIGVLTDDRTLNEIVEHIIRIYRRKLRSP